MARRGVRGWLLGAAGSAAVWAGVLTARHPSGVVLAASWTLTLLPVHARLHRERRALRGRRPDQGPGEPCAPPAPAVAGGSPPVAGP